jgi:hypothetical protein
MCFAEATCLHLAFAEQSRSKLFAVLLRRSRSTLRPFDSIRLARRFRICEYAWLHQPSRSATSRPLRLNASLQKDFLRRTNCGGRYRERPRDSIRGAAPFRSKILANVGEGKSLRADEAARRRIRKCLCSEPKPAAGATSATLIL